MNIIFMGTPEFAVPCLQCLLQERHQVSLVVTQGDKPKGLSLIHIFRWGAWTGIPRGCCC